MARYTWITAEPGIRYREHETRKFKRKPDRYYTIRFHLDGKRMEEALGWSSEGWEIDRVRAKLIALKEARRTGEGIASLKEARKKAQKKREEEAMQEEKEKAARITVDEFFETQYLPIQGHKKAETVEKEVWLYRSWLMPRFGHLPLCTITADHLEGLKADMLAAGKAPRTIQYAFAVFSQMWNRAQLKGIVVGISPKRQVKLPRIDNRRERFLTHKEANVLLAELKKSSYDIYATALLALACGLRAGEIHALRWNDINFENGYISIRDPKSRKNRFCVITDVVRECLETMYSGQLPQELVFPTATGTPRTQVNDAYDRAVKRLGLNEGVVDPRQKVVFHTLRHTFASWLVQQGVPLYTVGKLLGHCSLEMTQRYAHLAPDDMKAAASSISEIIKA